MSTTTASADRKTISPLSSQVESALAELAVAMIYADGIADDLELEVAYEQGGEIGIRRLAIDAAIHRRKTGEAYGFSDVLGAIPHQARGAATALLFEIACADDRLDRREVKLLEAVRDAWNKPIVEILLQNLKFTKIPTRKAALLMPVFRYLYKRILI